MISIIFFTLASCQLVYCQYQGDIKFFEELVDIQFTTQPEDANVSLGMDAFFSCTVTDVNTTMTSTHTPFWKITLANGSTMRYHRRSDNIPSAYTINGTGLIVHDVNVTMDGASISCCLGIFFMEEGRFRDECSRNGTLYINIDCEPPPMPPNGDINNYNTTTRDSEATFQCDEGLFPSDEMTAVCTLQDSGEGRWIPDPEEVECTDFCTYINNVSLEFNITVDDIREDSAVIAISCDPTTSEVLGNDFEGFIKVTRLDEENNGSAVLTNSMLLKFACKQNGTSKVDVPDLDSNTMYSVSLIVSMVTLSSLCPLDSVYDQFTTGEKKSSLLGIYIGIPLGVGTLILGIIILVIYLCRKYNGQRCTCSCQTGQQGTSNVCVNVDSDEAITVSYSSKKD